MTRAKQIENLIEIEDAICYFRKKIHRQHEMQQSFFVNFPTLIRKSKHDVIIFLMCIERLKERFNIGMHNINLYEL